MSKSALYKGLGMGLMSFGQGLQQQQLENARARREEALAQIRRQWQLEDKADDREFQIGLLDRQEETAEQARQFEIDERNRADAIAFGRQNQEWERGAPEREARLGLLEAQAESARARAERGTTGVDPSRWREMTLHEQRLIEQGKSPEEAYQQAMELVYPQRSDWEQQQMLRERVNLSRSIQETLNDDFARADLYESYGIPEETPPGEAAQLIFEQQWPTIERSVFGEEEQPQESGDPTQRPEYQDLLQLTAQALSGSDQETVIRQLMADLRISRNQATQIVQQAQQ